MRSRADAPEAERLILGVLRDYARRARELAAQADAYECELTRLIRSLAPTLLDEPGVGPISAAKLLACDAGRLKGEAAFARCNGTAPKPASSGQTIRHRLDRGGDRQSQQRDPHDRAQPLDLRRTDPCLPRAPHSEGKTKREAIRALKRHLSRNWTSPRFREVHGATRAGAVRASGSGPDADHAVRAAPSACYRGFVAVKQDRVLAK